QFERSLSTKRTIAADSLQALSQLQFAEGPLWILAVIEAQLASPPKWATPGGESTLLNASDYKSMPPGGENRSKAVRAANAMHARRQFTTACTHTSELVRLKHLSQLDIRLVMMASGKTCEGRKQYTSMVDVVADFWEAMNADELHVRNVPLLRLDNETGVGDDEVDTRAPKKAKLAPPSKALGMAPVSLSGCGDVDPLTFQAKGFEVCATIAAVDKRRDTEVTSYVITAIDDQTVHVRGSSGDVIMLKISEVLDGYTVVVKSEPKVVDCAQLDKFRRGNKGAATEDARARLRVALTAIEDVKIFGGGKLDNSRVNLIAKTSFRIGELQIVAAYDRTSVDKSNPPGMRISVGGGFVASVVLPSVLELDGATYAATLRKQRDRLDEEKFSSTQFWYVQLVHEGAHNVELRSTEISIMGKAVSSPTWANVKDIKEGQLILGPLQDSGDGAGGAVGSGDGAANRDKGGKGSKGGSKGGRGGKGGKAP
ncbi:unnamed protein product, partial [Prorocentrum cordatum]